MFWSKLLLSTGEANNYNKELTKNVKHTSNKSNGKDRKKNNTLEFILRCSVFGRPGGNSPLGRPRLILQYNIKMDIQEVGGGIGLG
jgi:hypothetical protein